MGETGGKLRSSFPVTPFKLLLFIGVINLKLKQERHNEATSCLRGKVVLHCEAVRGVAAL